MRLNKSNHGQGLVEMALVLPLFLILILGIYDFGIAFHTYSTLNQQCVEAAKAGTVRLNQLIGRGVFGSNTHVSIDTVRNAFWQRQSPLMPKDNYLENSPIITGVGVATNTVKVSAKYKITLITPVVTAIFGSGVFSSGTTPSGDLILSASAQMTKE